MILGQRYNALLYFNVLQRFKRDVVPTSLALLYEKLSRKN
jgi:hypothetical protein